MTTLRSGVRPKRAAVALAMLAMCVVVAAPAGAKDPKTDAKTGAATAAVARVAEPVSGPQVRGFQEFCDGWMQKLRDRETYNTAHITWENRDGLVSGEHVAYGTECTCTAREEPGKDPIGKITYREMRYRRRGPTQADALAAPGMLVEQTDVTEIFRYAKGRWQY